MTVRVGEPLGGGARVSAGLDEGIGLALVFVALLAIVFLGFYLAWLILRLLARLARWAWRRWRARK